MSAVSARPVADKLAEETRAALVSALRAGRPVRFVAQGSSMWPRVRAGAVLEVVPCAWTELRVGDLAAVERAAGVCVHRVIARTGTGLLCRGDARAASDPMASPAQVLGRARVLSQPALRLRAPRARDALAVLLAVRALLRIGTLALARWRGAHAGHRGRSSA